MAAQNCQLPHIEANWISHFLCYFYKTYKGENGTVKEVKILAIYKVMKIIFIRQACKKDFQKGDIYCNIPFNIESI